MDALALLLPMKLLNSEYFLHKKSYLAMACSIMEPLSFAMALTNTALWSVSTVAYNAASSDQNLLNVGAVAPLLLQVILSKKSVANSSAV